MRLFFALEAGDAIANRAWGIIQGSEIRRAPWRWIPPENYHFTLKFLGDVDQNLVPSLREAAREAASRVKPFRLGMGGIGAFPSMSRPRVVFYGIDGGFSRLRELAGLIEDECEPLGFERERRGFKAHLTLARLRRPAPEDALVLLREFPPLGGDATLDVRRFVLMSSRLTPSGAIYTVVSTFEFGG